MAVHSEDELKVYDRFKAVVFVLLLVFSAFAVAKENKAALNKKPKVGLSMVEPNGEDAYILTDTVRFKGDAPGAKVYLYSELKTLGEAPVKKDLTYEIVVPTKMIMDVDVSLVARDEKGNALETRGPMRFQIDEEVRKRAESTNVELIVDPVKIDTPVDEESIPVGPKGIFGTGAPKSRVKLYINKEHVGTVFADEEGKWSFVYKFAEAGPQVMSAVVSAKDTYTVRFNVTEEN